MKKYSSKIVVKINGYQKVMDGNLFFDKSIDNLPKFINTINPAILMKEVTKKVFNINEGFKGNICGDCKRMLDCPKVIEKEKRFLSKYPFITKGLEVILCNNAVRQEYLKALEEYNSLKDNKDFFLDDHAKLKSKLEDNGLDVALITVFGCSDFLPEEGPEKIKKPSRKYN